MVTLISMFAAPFQHSHKAVVALTEIWPEEAYFIPQHASLMNRNFNIFLNSLCIQTQGSILTDIQFSLEYLGEITDYDLQKDHDQCDRQSTILRKKFSAQIIVQPFGFKRELIRSAQLYILPNMVILPKHLLVCFSHSGLPNGGPHSDRLFGKMVLGFLCADHFQGETEILILLRNETGAFSPKMSCIKLNSE